MNNQYYLENILYYVKESLSIDITKKTNKREYAYGRSVYYKLSRTHTLATYEVIGSLVKLNHATVMHGINSIFPEAMKHEEELKLIYDSFVFEKIKDVGRLIYLTKELHELENKILKDYGLR